MLNEKSALVMSFLYIQLSFPKDLIQDITERCKIILKKEKAEYNREHFGRGKSREALKRRARQVNRCWKCGHLIHIGRCKKLSSRAQAECANALHQDPVKLKAVGSLRRNSSAYYMINHLVELRNIKINKHLYQ